MDASLGSKGDENSRKWQDRYCNSHKKILIEKFKHRFDESFEIAKNTTIFCSTLEYFCRKPPNDYALPCSYTPVFCFHRSRPHFVSLLRIVIIQTCIKHVQRPAALSCTWMHKSLPRIYIRRWCDDDDDFHLTCLDVRKISEIDQGWPPARRSIVVTIPNTNCENFSEHEYIFTCII